MPTYSGLTFNNQPAFSSIQFGSPTQPKVYGPAIPTRPTPQPTAPRPTASQPSPMPQPALQQTTASQPSPMPQPALQQNYDPNAAARQAAQDERSRYEQETRNQIESGYGAYESGLRNIQATDQAGQTQELNSASSIYDQIFGGLKDQLGTTTAKIDANRQDVTSRKAQSIKDLQQNLSSVMKGAAIQFGASGGGDSSATRMMLPYAYTKMAGQQEASISKQANEQLFQIDQDEKDTQLEFTKMQRQTEVDKETQLQSIKSYYGDRIRNVQMALAQAPADKAQALASLNQSLLAEAQNNLRQLESEYRQRQEGLQSWATERMVQLNNMKLQLAGNANFQPQDIVWNELQAAGAIGGGDGSSQFYNPLAVAQKRRDEYLA